MAVMLHPDDHDSQISMAFDAFDTNKDGRLGVDELRHVVGAIFATMEKMGIREETTDVNRTADDLVRRMMCQLLACVLAARTARRGASPLPCAAGAACVALPALRCLR